MSEAAPDHSPVPHPTTGGLAPYPGVHSMPRWDLGDLPTPPVFSWRQIGMFIGPGIVLGASAIGGGEWLTGPLNTARFGGALLWLSTLSILFQTLYNIEISRYTLYTGEPIFTGKFRIPPSPLVWLTFYLILDFGSILPYLASNAAIPLYALFLGRVPDPDKSAWTLKLIGVGILLGVMIPLSVGGKVYNSLKAVMVFKLFFVLGFLILLAVIFSTWSTWREIGSGFVKFGNYPIVAAGDGNANGRRDPGEAEHGANVANIFQLALSGGDRATWPALDLSVIGILAAMAAISGNGGLTNTPTSNYTRDQGWGMGRHVGAIPSIVGGQQLGLSHVGMVFRLTQENLKKWTGWVRHVQREQLMIWMPACFIGLALPSMLSVQFLPRGTIPNNAWSAAGMTAEGVAIAVSGLTPEEYRAHYPAPPVAVDGEPAPVKPAPGPLPAGANATRVSLGQVFWGLTLFCGFLVLATSCASTAEGTLRRWVDIVWTASPYMRTFDPKAIGTLYFGALCGYTVVGIVFLLWVPGDILVKLAGMLYNYALGFSCWHTIFVNTLLLPRELRPGVGRFVGLFFGGLFFITIAALTTYAEWGKLTAMVVDSWKYVTT